MNRTTLSFGMWLYRTPLIQFYLHHLPWRQRCHCWDDGETCSDKMVRAVHEGASFRTLKRICGAASTPVLILMVIGILGCNGASADSFSGIDFHRTAHDKLLAHEAVTFAVHQIGKPYVWGGNGPYSYDCSGLMNAAYGSVGINLSPGVPRATSETQWSDGVKVSVPNTGDLIFFAGADGTPSAPGHVGIIINAKKHLMIEAYAPGTNIRVAYYGTSQAPQGDENPIGVTDPTAGT